MDVYWINVDKWDVGEVVYECDEFVQMICFVLGDGCVKYDYVKVEDVFLLFDIGIVFVIFGEEFCFGNMNSWEDLQGC